MNIKELNIKIWLSTMIAKRLRWLLNNSDMPSLNWDVPYNSIISSYISDANFELKLSATITAMPSAVRHGRLESLPCLCVDRWVAVIWLNRKLLSVLPYHLPSTNVQMPLNWAQGHHGGVHCPVADCLISIWADTGPDVCMVSTAGLIIFSNF